MRIPVLGFIGALGATLFVGPSYGEEPAYEFAFMPRTMMVTLLNEGGKHVAIDLKHIPEGGTCRMDKDAIIVRIGPSTTSQGATVVRYIAPQISSGGCPFLTTFELSDADYSAARSAFQEKEAAAMKKIDDLKKQLGDKWDELMGRKPEKSGATPRPPEAPATKMRTLLSSRSTGAPSAAIQLLYVGAA